MLDSLPTDARRSARDKLVSLLDYVEQVVRLDERVAFDLADYKLADGKPARFSLADTGVLPGVQHDTADEHGPVWLAVERLARSEPPAPPDDLAPWVAVSSDPARVPEVKRERQLGVDDATRLARIAAGACATRFAPDESGADAPQTYTQTLLLAEQPSTAARLERWIAESWTVWAEMERPRRRTVLLYERLYKLLQQVETGGAEAPVEVVWGIGVARWQHAGRRLERPLLERAVDLELDAAGGGLLRVRPGVADATVDLKPYEEMGCVGLPLLDALIRREVERAAAEDGVSPFRRASFEPILAAAAARLQADGLYLPDPGEAPPTPGGTLTIDAAWVLFARPRSGHVLLADIDRLKAVARDPGRPIDGLSTRIVTEPSDVAGAAWEPLSTTLGGSAAPETAEEPVTLATEVFFPKPFNDDQIEIVRRLARSDGLVVQGPPGTGKTHTIANLICHAMATGQRVLVVSRGEAALAVLRDQLPDKVRPLAIALLSNERQGLGQVEGAIREIQTVVEGSRPEIRHAAIRRCEAEIVKLRHRITAIDVELDGLAALQGTHIGPRLETPADLARRIAGDRDLHAWFTDRPERYAADTGLTETLLAELSAARRRVGELIDHLGARLPSPADLPDPDEVAAWHATLVASADLLRSANEGPARGLRLAPADRDAAKALSAALDALAEAIEELPRPSWLQHFITGRPSGPSSRWAEVFATLCAEWSALDAERAETVAHAIELPPPLLDEADARAAVERGARGERLWPLLSIGKAGAKALVADVRSRGAPVREGDAEAWRRVAARLAILERGRDLDARWRVFGKEAGAPGAVTAAALAQAARAMRHLAAVRAGLDRLPGLAASLPSVETIADDPAQARALAVQLRHAAEAAALGDVRAAAARIRALFAHGEDRTASMARRFFDEALGRPDIGVDRIAPTWSGVRTHLDRLAACAGDFSTILALVEVIDEAGAPAWAERLRLVPARADEDPLIPAAWREVWDFAAADAHLGRIDARAHLAALASQRGEHERNAARLFVELVRERTFYTLERRLSPSVKSALVEFVRALGRLGKGTGKGAGKQRRAAREAMLRCYNAVPCWIMPTWRVAEQLPSDLAAFDLVILDEASQSDVTELPAVLRGRKILVVGDDRQVSPSAPFVAQGKIDQLRRRHLAGLPFQSLLEPGESLYTLMQAVFPDERLMLKEHFRCVEPIIRFSMQFYPETLLPLRIPSLAERLDPPLIDIHVPHGAREKGRKINPAEAAVIVEEIAALAATPGMERRSIGVISLIGADQAEHIRALLSERLGAELMQRHAILCGDSATFQGNERDIVFLSMVADRSRRTSLTMLRYAQRFNVAMSRARDRVVLVRSVERADLNPADLKARLIAHFEQPMPALVQHADGDGLERCESDFERDVLRRLRALHYRVEPQVGALGFRIDMVVEGAGGRRLAVECDGDSFHGPEQWREDMRRQRTLERVGWRFWRCFASSFYADPDGTLADLVDTLNRVGIEPVPDGVAPSGPSPYVARRVAKPPVVAEDAAHPELPLAPASGGPAPRTAGLHDRLVLAFADDGKKRAIVLTDGPEDWAAGRVALTSPLGEALAGREEEDEVDLPLEGGVRRVLVERVGGA